MSKIYKFYTYVRKQGVVAAGQKTSRYILKKLKITKRSIDVMAEVSDIIKADFYNHPYVVPQPKIKDKLSIGWVLSPVSPGSGGQSTIVRFARFLQEQGHSLTFYIYEGVQPQALKEARDILRSSFNFDVNVRKMSQYKESDVLIATGWETAYPVFNTRTNAHKFYFVQDFEPSFYGLGSKAVLAENTYRMGFYGITAGPWLSHRLSTDYSMQCEYFDFGADLDVYRASVPANVKRQKKVCFYARPVTERRAFEIGIISLGIFHKQHPEYVIEFIGWDVSEFNIPFPYVNRGILSPAELAELYHESVACLVLSLTNVSLLPLELLAAGCIPVINEGDNNSMVLGKNDFIHYAHCTPIQLAEELSNVVRVEDIDIRAEEAASSVQAKSWHESYMQVEKIITSHISQSVKRSEV